MEILPNHIAEVLQYAHSRRLFHRALGPQSVLVRDIESAAPRVQLMNWQTAARDAEGASAGTGSGFTQHRTAGTLHVQSYVEDPGLVYLAPETTRADPAHGAEVDVFSLGCLTWLIFTAQAPAGSTLELHERLRLSQGLRLSDAMDGCTPALQELVQFATSPDVLGRYGTVQEFIEQLNAVEDELTTPDPETTVDPSQANSGDRIEGAAVLDCMAVAMQWTEMMVRLRRTSGIGPGRRWDHARLPDDLASGLDRFFGPL